MSKIDRTWAVYYLRELARQPVNEYVAEDLGHIAECIERGSWPKGPHITLDQRLSIIQAVDLIARRPAGMSVKKSVSNQVARLAPRFDANTEAAKETLRTRIEAAWKARQRG